MGFEKLINREIDSVYFLLLFQAQFFRQHNLMTDDARQKYSSRVAQLYKDKLFSLSANAMKVYGTQVTWIP